MLGGSFEIYSIKQMISFALIPHAHDSCIVGTVMNAKIIHPDLLQVKHGPMR